jgi:DNA modification methylase
MKNLISDIITIDATVTSPPYNLNKAYGSYNDNKERVKYLDWLRDVV